MSDILFPKSFFITGTDTGVGKTLISAILMMGLSATYWKPIQSGTEESTDTDWLRQAAGLPDTYFIPEAYRLSKPLSPHAAALIDGVRIELSTFSLPQAAKFSHLIVEGAGGVMVPINERQYMVDLMKKLNIPVLLVARTGLGTINHTLLSLQCLRQNDLDVMGVVMNGPKNKSNCEAIEFYGGIKVVAQIDILSEITHQTLLWSFSEFSGHHKQIGKKNG